MKNNSVATNAKIMTDAQKKEMILKGHKFLYRGSFYFIGSTVANKCDTVYKVIDSHFDRQGQCFVLDDRICIYNLIAGHIVDITINLSQLIIVI